MLPIEKSVGKESQPNSAQNTLFEPQPRSEVTVPGQSYSPSGERTCANETHVTQPINIRYCLRVIYQNARTNCANTISSLIARRISFRWFGTSLASKVYKEHLLICRLEMVPHLVTSRMNSVWFVRVSIHWLSQRRVRTHVLRPPHSFQNADEALERGFRYGELWVDQKLSRGRTRGNYRDCGKSL